MTRFYVALAAATLWLSAPGESAAQVISLGNTATGFNDGDQLDIFQLAAAQAGQPAPFDQSYGSDPLADFSQSWTFAFAPVLNLGSASISFGVYDDDSGSPGDQLASFSFDANDLTSQLNAVMTSGLSGQYRVYTLALPGPTLASLADGSATFSLTLKGPVVTPPLFPGPDVIEPNNGANLIFSTLTLAAIPEPSPALLAGAAGVVGLAAAGLRRPARRS